MNLYDQFDLSPEDFKRNNTSVVKKYQNDVDTLVQQARSNSWSDTGMLKNLLVYLIWLVVFEANPETIKGLRNVIINREVSSGNGDSPEIVKESLKQLILRALNDPGIQKVINEYTEKTTNFNPTIKNNIKNPGNNYCRIIAYDTRYGGSGASRKFWFGEKVGGVYDIKVGGSENGKHTWDDAPLFKDFESAKAFILNTIKIKTPYEISMFSFSVSDSPIVLTIKDPKSGITTNQQCNNLDLAKEVDTICGKAYINNTSKYFAESLHEAPMPYTILGYGSLGTRKDSAYDLGSAKDRALKMLADKFVKKVDIMQQNNVVWSSKPAMAEAIEKHNELNQKLFNGEELKPEVREKVQDITNEMLRILAEEEIVMKVRDVILTGSNASYNYTKDSDIDVHILANTRDLEDPQGLYPKLYNAYRRIFASKYDISFYGIPVEVYIELEDNPVVSNGIYSIMYDCWIKKPTETEIPEIDQKAIDEAAKPWMEEAEALVKDGDSDKIDEFIKRLYEMRQHGIHSEGGSEYSTENLIFKEIRNAGLLDKLKELKNELIAQDLSLESLDEDLTEQERRSYADQIARIAHDQPIVHSNGLFEIHNVRNDDVNYIMMELKRKDWIEQVSKTPGKFDFHNVSGFGLPSRYWTIMGKVRFHKKELELTR